jgi:uncharacterized iron-regulated protein
MRSVQNAYLGGYHSGTDGEGLDAFVASRDAVLDERVKTEIQATIDLLAAVPTPFEQNLDAAAQIEAAQNAMRTAMATLQEDVKPLFAE